MRRGALAAAAGAIALLLSACGSGSTPGASPRASSTVTPTASGGSASTAPGGAYTSPPATIPVPGVAVTMSTAAPPWPPPALIDAGKESAAYVAAAGLPYGEEMLKVHYHAHLDVIVDGKQVPVPAYLGFVAKGHSAIGLSALHTHDSSGVIHIENDRPATFVLGQLFTEWGVRFTASCLGGSCAGNGKELAVFVAGTRYSGDPTKIVLAKHQEIAVVYGDAGKLPAAPASYHFPNGE